MKRLAPLALAMTAFAGQACTGGLDTGPRGPTGTGGRGIDRPITCDSPVGSSAPMRRLTIEQWQGSVRALLGDAAVGDSVVPAALYRRGFRTFAEANEVSADAAYEIAEASFAIAERASTDLPRLMGCSPGPGADDACASEWIARFTREAFRRAPSAEELSTLRGVYSSLVSEGYAPREAASSVIEATLQTPQFLYLAERGASGGDAGAVVAMRDHDVAARLSYFLWDEPPDDTLAAAADAGELHTREQIEGHARRMAEDPRAAGVLGRFVEDWLEIYRVRGAQKDAATYPAWTSIVDSVEREHLDFVEEIYLRGDRRISTLLGAAFTVGDDSLADLYDAARPVGGFGRIDLEPSERAGLLTRAGFLASHSGSSESAPVVRGATILRNVLCVDIELPIGLMVSSPSPDPSRTVRERFEEHRSDPACGGCHEQIDPLGFGLEAFDAIGAFRMTDEHGHDIDASGVLARTDVDGAFVGGAELSARLAQSDTVRDCVARQMLQYAEGRFLETRGDTAEWDQCAFEPVRARFEESGGDMRELLIAIATSDAFLARRIPQGVE